MQISISSRLNIAFAICAIAVCGVCAWSNISPGEFSKLIEVWCSKLSFVCVTNGFYFDVTITTDLALQKRVLSFEYMRRIIPALIVLQSFVFIVARHLLVDNSIDINSNKLPASQVISICITAIFFTWWILFNRQFYSNIEDIHSSFYGLPAGPLGIAVGSTILSMILAVVTSYALQFRLQSKKRKDLERDR